MSAESNRPMASASPLDESSVHCGSEGVVFEHECCGWREFPDALIDAKGLGSDIDELAYRGFLALDLAPDADEVLCRLALLAAYNDKSPTLFPGPDRWM